MHFAALQRFRALRVVPENARPRKNARQWPFTHAAGNGTRMDGLLSQVTRISDAYLTALGCVV